ncbi:MAG TPA: PIN domain-containing protein [Rubrobacter sp.]|nr:PIN domain-containing protein [Rubrobacter sp.]
MPPFFDTNVLVYLVDEDEPEKQRIARGLLEEHLAEGDGAISVQVLREFYWVAKRLDHPLSEERAREAVNDFAEFASVSEDAGMVLRAVRRHREMSLPFWDALIVEAALKAGADRLFTEDLQHGQVIEGMRVENPFL